MNSKKPLQGFKVLDFSAVFAGPICTRFLLDCGADVIKVETPGMGDLTRGVDGMTHVFGHFNAGKRSIAVDLKSRQGQSLVKRLLDETDIVVENFRPGIMAKFGLDYETLSAEHANLVYCSISGFGQSGPYVHRAAFAPIVHAASGFDTVQSAGQGNPENRPPNWDIMVADILTGSYAFGAIQTALLGRERHGGGEYVDVSMMEAMMTMIPAHIQGAQMEEPAIIGRFHPVKVKDGFVMLCAVSNKNLESLSQAMGRPDLLTDPRFIRGPRAANFDQLALEVERWSVNMTAMECEAALNSAGVPCSAYQKVEDLFSHPQVVERKSFTEISHATLGDFLIQNMPVRFKNNTTTASSHVATLGEHTTEVFLERLGMEPAEVEELRSQGILA